VWHFAHQSIWAFLTLQAIQLPSPTGYVNDFANVIPAESRARIQAIIDDVREKSGGEIVVVTLSDIGDRAASDVALQLGREWRVGASARPGDPTRNTGTIILLVPKEVAVTASSPPAWAPKVSSPMLPPDAYRTKRSPI
jgi:uncharacterized membrane protein YgcG